VSFSPWITSNGQDMSLQFYSLLKAYLRSRLAHFPYRSLATFFREIKGLSSTAECTVYFSVTVNATAHPIDLPNTMT
jgi:hypothetical protein